MLTPTAVFSHPQEACAHSDSIPQCFQRAHPEVPSRSKGLWDPTHPRETCPHSKCLQLVSQASEHSQRKTCVREVPFGARLQTTQVDPVPRAVPVCLRASTQRCWR